MKKIRMTLQIIFFGLLTSFFCSNAWCVPGKACGDCDSGESCVNSICYKNCEKNVFLELGKHMAKGQAECACSGGTRGIFGWQPLCSRGQVCYLNGFGKNTCGSVNSYIQSYWTKDGKETARKEIGNQACGDGGFKSYQNSDDDEIEYFCIGLDNKYIGGIAAGCSTIPAQIMADKICFFCYLFAILYDAADDMAYASFSRMGNVFSTILLVGWALWLAILTLNHVSSLTKQDGAKYLGTILKQSFKVLIVFYLLVGSNHVYDYVVNPLLSAGLNMGTTLLNVSGNDMVKKASNSAGGQMFYTSTYNDLERFTMSVQRKIAVMQSIGKSLICVGSNNLFSFNFGRWGSAFMMVVQGAIIAGFAFLLSLAFGFYLIDAIVQLGIVGALMPFLILCWPFKLTSKYTGKGFDILLNSCFVFIFMAIAINIDFALIEQAMVQSADTAGSGNCNGVIYHEDGTKEATKNLSCGNFSLVYDAINKSDYDELRKLTDISGLEFLILLACCIFGFKFVGQASGLAGQMAGGALKGIGSSIGTMAASAIKSTALKTTAPMREAAVQKTKSAAGSVLKGTGHGIVTGAKWITSSKFRKDVKINRTLKKNQKQVAKKLAKMESGAKVVKDKETGNRNVLYKDGSGASVDKNGNIKYNTNVEKTQNADGSFSYRDSQSGNNLTEAQARMRENATTRRRNRP